MDVQERTKAMREFLRDSSRLNTDFKKTDQAAGITMPLIQKSLRPGQTIMDLPDPTVLDPGTADLKILIQGRESVRSYSDEAVSLPELSWLLFASQGVRKKLQGMHVFRTVPSAGNRHPFETYLVIYNVRDLEPGIYRYLPLDHALVQEQAAAPSKAALTEAALGQSFAAKGALNFIWTVLPYRTEWRYGPSSAKVIAMDIGHVCAHLYLAAGSIRCGTCEIAAYHQEAADRLLNVDGEDEFVIAMCPVGKLRR